MRWLYLLSFLCLSAGFAHAQDSLIIAQHYCIYRQDTINRYDGQGRKTGPWIFFRIDTSIVHHVVSDCYVTAKGKRRYQQSYAQTRQLTPRAYIKGHYDNGRKQGCWQFSCDNFETLELSASYSNDTLQSGIQVFDGCARPRYAIENDTAGWWRYKPGAAPGE